MDVKINLYSSEITTDVDVSLMKKVMDDADSLLQRFPELKGTKEKPFTLKIVII